MALEDLVGFPYANHEEFKEALQKKEIEVLIQTSATYDVGRQKSDLPWRLLLLFQFLPFLLIIGYSIISSKWYMLFGVLLPVLGFFLFNPTAKKSMGSLTTILLLGLYIGLVYAIFIGSFSTIVLIISALIEDWWHQIGYGIHRAMTNEMLVEDPNSVGYLWSHHLMFIRDQKGQCFFSSLTL